MPTVVIPSSTNAKGPGLENFVARDTIILPTYRFQPVVGGNIETTIAMLYGLIVADLHTGTLSNRYEELWSIRIRLKGWS
jgi:hypothetical protein